ncbi:DUF2178 domain-containing protein [Methanococcus maripaludis]|mgnify:CR=1 FL=1|uniref:Conserved hypothetical archaeal protein n=2 Tax=Methanococcus maripaludis TaxID=39152 RepID=Q6LZF4_METMP|nr:DUF2178 domain-containing protein [Methanococcus maripaludis]MBA2846523.1 putative membrane protein [Methanococcus maripaludis]MBB6067775.1 putative membrane protein [Methanococcus maripaludis]MBM7408662.1 putative membrane protein [Methanococcus maripaludis]MBP2219819.1 putative membrane protein [Methanococcus maripaludis]CAF30231.1 conserved hypothetical archaeal protein [Methanococcus maripaludis S2]
MDLKTYKKYLRILIITVAILVSLAITTGNGYLAVLIVIIGIFTKMNLSKKLDEVIEDELLHKVAEKASYLTIQVVCLLFALLGVFLTTFETYVPGYTLIGTCLAYSAIFILFVNMLFRYIFSKKYGLI